MALDLAAFRELYPEFDDPIVSDPRVEQYLTESLDIIDATDSRLNTLQGLITAHKCYVSVPANVVASNVRQIKTSDYSTTFQSPSELLALYPMVRAATVNYYARSSYGIEYMYLAYGKSVSSAGYVI
jgi:hypothetical protein